MNNKLSKPYQLAGLKLIGFQFTVAVFATLIISIIWGSSAALSAFAGGMIAVLPNFVFVLYAFRFVGASKMDQVYKSFKRGTSLKFMLTIVMFVLVFKTITIVPLALFGCFILVNYAQWSSAIFFNH